MYSCNGSAFSHHTPIIQHVGDFRPACAIVARRLDHSPVTHSLVENVHYRNNASRTPVFCTTAVSQMSLHGSKPALHRTGRGNPRKHTRTIPYAPEIAVRISIKVRIVCMKVASDRTQASSCQNQVSEHRNKGLNLEYRHGFFSSYYFIMI